MGLATEQISILQLISVASSQIQGFIPQATPHAFPLTNLRHTLLLCTIDIQTHFYAFLHGINPPLPRPTHWTATSTLPYTDPLRNIVLLHSLHMTERSENTFINPFVHTSRHSSLLPYPCIRDFIHSPDTQQTSKVVHQHSPNPRPLLVLLSHCHT